MKYDTNFKSVKDQVSPEEWQARVELAACYRLVDHYGMTDLIYNHITARIPGTEHLLINLYGLLYKEITASSLVKIDVEGEIIAKPDTDYGINKSGYVIHGAIHKARPDVNCVMHTHTRAGMAVSAMNCGLLPLSQTSIRFHNHIGYHDYEGPAVDLDERERIVSDLGEHDALVMRNHGLLTCGPTVPEAFNLMYQLEQSCRSQVDCHGGAHRADCARRERAGPHRASLPARHAAALRRAGMAGDAAPARRRAEELRLSAVLALTFGRGSVDEACRVRVFAARRHRRGLRAACRRRWRARDRRRADAGAADGDAAGAADAADRHRADSGLAYVRDEGKDIAIGATTRQHVVENDPLIRAKLPLLAKVMPFVGHSATRARGTVGGSLANGDPAAEIVLVAVTLGATLVWREARQEQCYRRRRISSSARW